MLSKPLVIGFVLIFMVDYLCFAVYTNSYSPTIIEPIAVGIMLSHMLEDGKKEKKKHELQES